MVTAHSSLNLRIPLTHYTAEKLAHVIIAPPAAPHDPVQDNILLNSMLRRADRVSSGVFVLNKQTNSVEYFEDVMHHVMTICNDDEAFRWI